MPERRVILRYERVGLPGGEILHISVEKRPMQSLFEIRETDPGGKEIKKNVSQVFDSSAAAIERFDEEIGKLLGKKVAKA